MSRSKLLFSTPYIPKIHCSLRQGALLLSQDAGNEKPPQKILIEIHQARSLARQLLEAADEADRRKACGGS